MAIAVSACLLGEPCRYDGASKPCADVAALAERFTLVPVCPEVLGGLPVPRPPSEIQPDGRVVNSCGQDVTSAYNAGAAEAVRIAKAAHCTAAVLKAKSPACGPWEVYDGSFSRTLAKGQGVAARAFLDAGIPVVCENTLQKLEGVGVL